MPIRTKIIEYCYWTPSPNPSQICVDQEVPIRDWSIMPGQLNKSWTQGTAATPLFQEVTFPELEALYAYDKYKFKIRKILSTIDWLEIHSVRFGNAQEFPLTDNPKVKFDFDFVNLDNLPVGQHYIDVSFDAYGIDPDNNEHYLENYSTNITLNVKAGNIVSTDQNNYELTYNQATNTLSGDDKIIIYATGQIDFTSSENFIQLSQTNEAERILLKFLSNQEIENKSIGSYTGKVSITKNGYTKSVDVLLNVINDPTEYDVNPKAFNITLQKAPGEIKTEIAELSNPNNLAISVELKPSFISSATIVSNQLIIKTENSTNLTVGKYEGKIMLKAGDKIKNVNISLNVFQSIEHDFRFSPYFFALDPNKATLLKNHPNATYVKMKLEMYFKGYGEEYSENKEYSIPYFKGKAEFYPGREVNDFFIRAYQLEPADVVYLMDLAQVKITFNEMSDTDEVLSTVLIDNLLFAPGKKPVCYPVFTNYKTRRTFPGSHISINVDRMTEKETIKQLKELYSDPFPPSDPTTCIDLYRFKRDRFNTAYEKNIISTNELQFIPVPEKRDIIHIYWENQNRVFEWFSAPLKYQQKDEIESIFSETSMYKEEKFVSEEASTLIINTGWILREEIPMITDILKSRICFIELNQKRIKAYPVGKTNELLKSDENTFEMDLEFKILKNKEF